LPAISFYFVLYLPELLFNYNFKLIQNSPLESGPCRIIFYKTTGAVIVNSAEYFIAFKTI
jgi:hypothetical protein